MTRALLVIDVQESFRQGPLWPAISNPAIASDVARLVDGVRVRGDLVVWVLHSEPGSGTPFDPANGHVRYMEPLAPRPGEPQLTKTSHNAFTTTNLQQVLTQRGITEVIVCGIRTEQCGETTARVAFDLGYQVTFVTEATATNPIAHRDAPAGQTVGELLADPRTLPASAVIERTEYALAGRFATIATIAEATGQAPAPWTGRRASLACRYPDQIVTTVVFLLVPGLHLLDLAGPAQAFGTAADLGCGYELAYVAETEDVPAAQGVTLRAATRWPALGADDLVIVPGWRAAPAIAGTGPLAGDTLGALAAHHARGGTVASVCAGTDALGRAGLLDGRRCTTHHDIQDELARRYPRATVVRDVLYVIDGRVATSAGIASGIDLALHLIAVRDGPATAARVAREMVVYARRNGDDQQASAMLRHRNHLSDTAHRAQDHIEARFSRSLPLAEIARTCGVSERTLTRKFTEATGVTPLRYQQLLRLERAEHLIGHGATVEAAARTVGFTDARMLRRLRAREPA